MKKWLIIAGSILGMLFMVWWFFDADKTEPATPSAQTGQNVTFRLVPVVRSVVKNPNYSSDGNIVWYYSPGDSSLKRFSVTENTETILRQLNFLPSRIIWSPNADQVLAEHGGFGTSKLWYLADLRNSSVTALRSGIEDPTWTTAGEKIFYKFYSAQSRERSLNVANPDGSNWRKLMDINIPNIRTASLAGNRIGIWPAPNSRGTGDYYSIDTSTGETRRIIEGKYGADYLPDRTTGKILISHLDKASGSPTMAVVNEDGSGYRNLGIASFATKSAWSADGRFLFIAVPKFLPNGYQYPEDVVDGSVQTQDVFYLVNPETGESAPFYDPGAENRVLDAESLFVDNQKRLYFVDRYGGQLYRLDPVIATE